MLYCGGKKVTMAIVQDGMHVFPEECGSIYMSASGTWMDCIIFKTTANFGTVWQHTEGMVVSIIWVLFEI